MQGGLQMPWLSNTSFLPPGALLSLCFREDFLFGQPVCLIKTVCLTTVSAAAREIRRDHLTPGHLEAISSPSKARLYLSQRQCIFSQHLWGISGAWAKSFEMHCVNVGEGLHRCWWPGPHRPTCLCFHAPTTRHISCFALNGISRCLIVNRQRSNNGRILLMMLLGCQSLYMHQLIPQSAVFSPPGLRPFRQLITFDNWVTGRV